MKFSIKHFFSKYDQIRSFLWTWLHLLKKSLMGETSIFVRCYPLKFQITCTYNSFIKDVKLIVFLL